MLSYSKDSLKDDFARAQALATDSYRPQLVAQQQAVQKAGANVERVLGGQQRGAVGVAGPGRRCCWPCRASAAPTPKDLRFITATVRADFEKSGDGEWRVANLTVLKKPFMDGRRSMSPRRKIDAEEPELYTAPAPKPPRRWGLPLVASAVRPAHRGGDRGEQL